MHDLEFKFIFAQHFILEDFINSYYDYIKENKKFLFSSIKAQDYIMPNNRRIKGFFGDIVACLDNGEAIIIEAYTKFGRREYVKSFNYLTRHYSNQIKMGDDNYQNCKKVTILNLMMGNYRKINNKVVNQYKMKNDITNKIIDNGEIEFVLIRVDQIAKGCYTKDEQRFIKWLKLISAKDIEEMENIGRGDKIMESTIQYLKRYSGSDMDHNFNDIIAYHEDCAREEGEKSGIKMGIKSGIRKTAKNFLKEGIDIKIISKATGLSIEQIKNLKQRY